jgi:DNA-binding response OmpR family regulator
MSRQYSILVIGDDCSLRHSLALILERAGYAVTTSAGSQAELRDLKQMHCDLIFLDLTMPAIDGPFLLPRLRQLQPHVPIIMLAVQDSPEIVVELRQSGVTGFLPKPIEPKCMLAQIHALLIEKQILGPEGNSHATTPLASPQPGQQPPPPGNPG